MVLKTVLKVDISCENCKKKLLKSVSTLQGVDKIEADVAKGTLTVTGNADPYEIILRARKVSKFVEVVSVGPPPPPPKQDAQKKPEEKKPDDKKPVDKKPEQKAQQYHTPETCPICQHMAMMQVARYEEPSPACTIM